MIATGITFCILCYYKREKIFDTNNITHDFLRGTLMFSGIVSLIYSPILSEANLRIPLALGGITSFSIALEYLIKVGKE